MTKTILSVSLMILAGVATPAVAQNEGSPVRVVRFADLNLATPQGVAALDRRIHVAVKEICGDADLRDLAGMRAVEQCRKATLATAINQRVAAIAAATGDHSARLAAR